MKTSTVFFLGILAWFLAPERARADQKLFMLRGAQLESYSVQAEGPRVLALSADLNLKWARTAAGITCEEEFNHDHGERCFLRVKQRNSLRINDFLYPRPGCLFHGSYGWGESVSDASLERIKQDTELALSPAEAVNLADVQAGTVFARNGSCYSIELRFFADSASRVISRYWFERVAARCP
jgi:hypothetical protein